MSVCLVECLIVSILEINIGGGGRLLSRLRFWGIRWTELDAREGRAGGGVWAIQVVSCLVLGRTPQHWRWTAAPVDTGSEDSCLLIWG